MDAWHCLLMESRTGKCCTWGLSRRICWYRHMKASCSVFILAFPVTTPTSQAKEWNLDPVCVRRRRRMVLSKCHWQTQEEIQHLNFKNKVLMFVHFNLPSEHGVSQHVSGWFLRTSSDCWHDHGCAYSWVTNMNALCVSRADTEMFPKEIKRHLK